MFGEARRLVAWGTIGGGALLGCRTNVYLGNPIALEDHVAPEAGPVDAPAVDAPDAPQADVPVEADVPYPWYLHGVGSKILDSNDVVVHLHGVNWSGMQTVLRVPDGLHVRTIESIVAQIEMLGFNLIRIPFSSQSILPTSLPTKPISGIDPVGGDPDLAGLTSLQVLDRIVDAAFRHHLRVIFDHYRFVAADTSPPSQTWYSGSDPNSSVGGFPEMQWRQDWVALATRYANKPSVVACDLHDELATPSTWGDGNMNTDWRLAAERAGNDILDANPNLVILVQGIDVVGGQEYWAGGNLQAAQAAPVRLKHPEKLFYSVRDWGKSVNTAKPWFASASFPNNLPMLWDNNWGYLLTNDVTPVVVGAFGDQGSSAMDPGLMAADRAWRTALTSYISTHQVSFAFWALNPSAEGKSGLLQPQDWLTPDPDWLTILPLTP
jgi:endoglucanase